MPPYIYLASIGYVDLDIIVGQDELLELRKNTNSNQPTKRLNLMFPVNTAILAIASGNLQPYNRTGIEAADGQRFFFLSFPFPLEVGGTSTFRTDFFAPGVSFSVPVPQGFLSLNPLCPVGLPSCLCPLFPDEHFDN